MSVVIKGSNDVLIFHCKIEVSLDDVLKEIDRLLDQPLFNQNGYFPKAFFDFGCRYLNEDELNCLLELLFVKKKVLFYGINLNDKVEKIVDVYDKTIHDGEVIKIDRDTLFLYPINKGSTIYTKENVYFLNSVKGRIVALDRKVQIFGHDFDHAYIRIMNHYIQDMTCFTNIMIYDNGEDIVTKKETDLWLESL